MFSRQFKTWKMLCVAPEDLAEQYLYGSPLLLRSQPHRPLANHITYSRIIHQTLFGSCQFHAGKSPKPSNWLAEQPDFYVVFSLLDFQHRLTQCPSPCRVWEEALSQKFPSIPNFRSNAMSSTQPPSSKTHWGLGRLTAYALSLSEDRTHYGLWVLTRCRCTQHGGQDGALRHNSTPVTCLLELNLDMI